MAERVIILLLLAIVVLSLAWLVRWRARSATQRTQGQALPDALQEHLPKSGPGIVYFYGPHCASCHQQARVLDDLTRATNVPVVRLDATQERHLSDQLAVMTVPSTVVVVDQVVRSVNLGFLGRDALAAQVGVSDRSSAEG